MHFKVKYVYAYHLRGIFYIFKNQPQVLFCRYIMPQKVVFQTGLILRSLCLVSHRLFVGFVTTRVLIEKR